MDPDTKYGRVIFCRVMMTKKAKKWTWRDNLQGKKKSSLSILSAGPALGYGVPVNCSHMLFLLYSSIRAPAYPVWIQMFAQKTQMQKYFIFFRARTSTPLQSVCLPLMPVFESRKDFLDFHS